MTIKELKEILNRYNEDGKVYIYVENLGKDRELTEDDIDKFYGKGICIDTEYGDRKYNFRRQRFERCCGNCKNIKATGVTFYCTVQMLGEVGPECICDKWEKKEEEK